jgi:hypothetical protein
MVMTITDRAGLPSTVKLSHKAESTWISAFPLTRRVVPEPGIKNNSPTLLSRMMFLRESARLLPCRSGTNSVLSSWMRHEAGQVTARAAIESFWAAGCQSHERRCRDQGSIFRNDPVEFPSQEVSRPAGRRAP